MSRDVILPKKARAPGRPPGRFTQHRRIEAMLVVLEGHAQGVTLEELAAVMRCSTRSVQRYVHSLRDQLGLEAVPTTPGGPNRWRIKPSERGRAITLRRTQAYLLLAARKAFEPLRGSALYDELDVAHRELLQVAERPLRAAHTVDIQPGARLDERVVIVPYPARSYVANGGDLDEIFRAAAELRVVRFRADGRHVRVCPYVLAIHNGSVDCIGLDIDRNEVRVFPLDVIREAEIDNRRFELPADLDPERLVFGAFGSVPSGDGRRAVIEFDAGVAAAEVRSRKHHPDQRVATSKDGRVRLALPIGNRGTLVRWVLGFGSAARVVEPDDLAELVREELRQALRKAGG